MSRDRLALRGLRAFGYHGVLPAERRQGQEFLVDAVLELDTAAAAASDHLDDTVDYSALAARLAAVVSGEPVALVETLAARLAAACLHDGRVAAVEVSVHKPHAPMPATVADVVVSVRRERGPQ